MPKTVQELNDDQLVKSLQNSVNSYSILYSDPDGFRFGNNYFKNLEKKMSAHVTEIFNRVANDGLKTHKSVTGVYKKLAELSASDRKDGEKVYRTLSRN